MKINELSRALRRDRTLEDGDDAEGAGLCAVVSPARWVYSAGAVRNSSALPGGSPNDTPEPYGASMISPAIVHGEGHVAEAGKSIHRILLPAWFVC
jgi:hypothetical protein